MEVNMKIIMQRVSRANLDIDGKTFSSIKNGLVLLVGVKSGDSKADAEKLAKKIVKLRIFDDEKGVMNKSILDVDGEILSVSNFTLYADCSKGCRPSYSQSAKYQEAKDLYECFNKCLCNALGKDISTGNFGADMQIELINDGPVTIIVDSQEIGG